MHETSRRALDLSTFCTCETVDRTTSYCTDFIEMCLPKRKLTPGHTAHVYRCTRKYVPSSSYDCYLLSSCNLCIHVPIRKNTPQPERAQYKSCDQYLVDDSSNIEPWKLAQPWNTVSQFGKDGIATRCRCYKVGQSGTALEPVFR